jgi:hypothetical protein
MGAQLTKRFLRIITTMTLKNIILKTVFVVSIVATAISLPAQSPITISMDTKNPSVALSPNFPGLSFETSQLLPTSNGVRYFRPDNQPLITLFQTLGIKSLRVGGNTADRNFRGAPSKADIDSLFAFAKAAGVKVIYCLRLHDGNPQEDADVAKYIMDHYADQIACFSIGQEPNVYPRTTNWVNGVAKKSPRPAYADYAKAWKKFHDVIMTAAPNAKFCGPSVDSNPTWPQQFMSDFGRGNNVVMITAHLYPGRAGDRVPSPEIGRDEMLSNGFITVYQKLYDGFGATAVTDGLPYRLEEVNNFYNGGAMDVSDTFASALWGLDFMYWWAIHGADGINFHTGDKVGAGSELRPSRYTAYFSTPDGFLVRPLGYGIKAFDVGAHGRILPATISNPDNLNVSIYPVLGDDKNIYVTIINKEHAEQAKDANVSLNIGGASTDAQAMSLTVSGGDIAAKTGTTLGGAQIKNDGSWSGKWTDLPPAKNGSLALKIPAASAVIIKLKD